MSPSARSRLPVAGIAGRECGDPPAVARATEPVWQQAVPCCPDVASASPLAAAQGVERIEKGTVLAAQVVLSAVVAQGVLTPLVAPPPTGSLTADEADEATLAELVPDLGRPRPRGSRGPAAGGSYARSDGRLQAAVTGRRTKPRSVRLLRRSGTPVMARPSYRLTRAGSAIRASSRARGAPRQKWMPVTNAGSWLKFFLGRRPTGRTTLTATSAGARSKTPKPRF